MNKDCILITNYMASSYRKCKDTILSCETEDQLENAVRMCNMFGGLVCNFLNKKDFKYISGRFNIHKRWCKQQFEFLNEDLRELDDCAKTKGVEISEKYQSSGIGFNN